MNLGKAFSFIFLIFLLLLPLSAENIRGNVTSLIDLSLDSQNSVEYDMMVNEIIGIFPGSKSDFIEGIEISVKIPAPLLQSGTTFLLIFYKQVTPAIVKGIASFRALEAGHMILPNRARIYLEMPLNTQPGASSSFPLEGVLSLSDFPLLATIIPLSKGAPSSLETNPLQVKFAPVLGDRGKAQILLSGDKIDESTLAIWIDDQKINFSGQELILPTGIHTILAQAAGARDINRSFAVQKAQTIRVVLPFEHLISTVLFEAPETAQIFLDGNKLTFSKNNPFEISDGEHTALFILGDYRISKHFRIAPGKNYKISLFLDILLQEY